MCQNHKGKAVRDASFSPDGKSFASICDSGELALYSRDTLAVASHHKIHTSRGFSLSWSHDSTMVVTGGLSDNAKVMDAKTGAVLATLSGQGCKSINCVRCVGLNFIALHTDYVLWNLARNTNTAPPPYHS